MICIGDKFHKLTVIDGPTDVRMPWSIWRRHWRCQCDCGNTVTVRQDNLKRGHTVSCSCAKRTGDASTNAEDRLANCWSHMRSRCGNPTDSSYADYGGRGIKVCEDWLTFENFKTWALANGYDHNLYIDGIDVDGNYEPANCRWISRRESARNKRHTLFITAWRETMKLVDWSEDSRCLVPYATLYQRLRRGWSPEVAMRTPVRTTTPPN